MFSFLEIVTEKIFFFFFCKALLDHIQPNFIDRRTEIRIDSI